MTRDVQEPICHGAGKLHFATEFAAFHGSDLRSSYFSADSAIDLPPLERVGNPVAVSPQRLLRQHSWRSVRFLELAEIVR